MNMYKKKNYLNLYKAKTAQTDPEDDENNNHPGRMYFL